MVCLITMSGFLRNEHIAQEVKLFIYLSFIYTFNTPTKTGEYITRVNAKEFYIN